MSIEKEREREEKYPLCEKREFEPLSTCARRLIGEGVDLFTNRILITCRKRYLSGHIRMQVLSHACMCEHTRISHRQAVLKCIHTNHEPWRKIKGLYLLVGLFYVYSRSILGLSILYLGERSKGCICRLLSAPGDTPRELI